MSSVKKVTISVPETVLEKIDTVRGLVPRSTYITQMLKIDTAKKIKRSDS